MLEYKKTFHVGVIISIICALVTLILYVLSYFHNSCSVLNVLYNIELFSFISNFAFAIFGGGVMLIVTSFIQYISQMNKELGRLYDIFIEMMRKSSFIYIPDVRNNEEIAQEEIANQIIKALEKYGKFLIDGYKGSLYQCEYSINNIEIASIKNLEEIVKEVEDVLYKYTFSMSSLNVVGNEEFIKIDMQNNIDNFYTSVQPLFLKFIKKGEIYSDDLKDNICNISIDPFSKKQILCENIIKMKCKEGIKEIEKIQEQNTFKSFFSMFFYSKRK